jgi:hypothetical protein
MSLVTTGDIVVSIVPFDPTYGITIVATVMLALFVLAMVFPAIAPLVSSKWSKQLDAGSGSRAIVEPTGGKGSEASTDDVAAGGSAAAAGDVEPDLVGAAVRESGSFEPTDVGKLVERADGKVIGTVASVDGDTAHVDPKPDVLDQILVRFDRQEPGKAFDLEADSVLEISRTRVHLEPDFARSAAAPTTEADAETSPATAE